MKFITNIFYGVMIVLILVVGTVIAGTVLPLPWGLEMKIVKSGSMEPSIPTGALVLVWPQQSYQVGDVITFGKDTKKDIPTTHRIVEVKEVAGQTTFVTQGDANDVVDPKPVSPSEVIGVVGFSLPKVGYILDFARTRDGFLFMVVIPAIFIILDELFVIFQTLRGGRGQKTTAVALTSQQAPTSTPVQTSKQHPDAGVLVLDARRSLPVQTKRPKAQVNMDGVIVLRHV